VEGHVARGEPGPACADHERKENQKPEQVAEEDEDEGPDLLGDDAREDGVNGDAAGGGDDQQGTLKHRRHAPHPGNGGGGA
jgi:hypothetical protein